jgi:hypothetical protein
VRFAENLGFSGVDVGVGREVVGVRGLICGGVAVGCEGWVLEGGWRLVLGLWEALGDLGRWWL